MKGALPALLPLFAISLAGCASFRGHCPSGTTRLLSAELFFGRSIANGGFVSDADWASFMDKEVTPRFPDGLTAFDAQGQWRGADGKIVREPSKAVVVIIKGGQADQDKIEAIRTAYKTQFRQDSVLLLEHYECAAF